MTEIWKDIKNYEGLYQVSNLGRVKSVDRYGKHCKGGMRLFKGRFVKGYFNSRTGYLQLLLCKNGKNITKKVHRLVAEAFIPNPDNLPCVNHKDKNRTNNSVDNLEWCTYDYNNKYGNRLEEISKPVEQYTKDGQFVAEYYSAREAARQTGIYYTLIYGVCKNDKYRHTAGGYVWKYK